MRIGGENRPSWILQKHWKRFSESTAIKPGLVLKTLKEMSAAIIPAVQALSTDFTNSYGTCPIIEEILAVIEKRAKAV